MKPPLSSQEISQTKNIPGALSWCQLIVSKINQRIWACKENVVIWAIRLYKMHLKAHETSLQ
jgi:hypothetical protein